jgi:hypothetical protein
MKQSIYDKVVQALNQAKQHNGNIMVKPEVILWPDPELQWTSIIPALQEKFPALLVYGNYEPAKKQGPAIWLKCMVAQTLPSANWDVDEIPIIYLPGISKNDLRNIQNAGLDFQPLIEYQYTGTIFTQDNGKEWTIMAFLQNPLNGLGLKVAQDLATRDTLKKSLPTIFKEPDTLYGPTIVDAAFLNNMLSPDIISNILKWMCKGDKVLNVMPAGNKETFINLCKTQYGFEPDQKNIKDIAEKLGAQKNGWKQVWQHYAIAPKKFAEIQDLLMLAKPADLGSGMFAYPEESWPQVNEMMEDQLRKSLLGISKYQPKDANAKLKALQLQHEHRNNWVWAELGQAPLANALPFLIQMADRAVEAFPFSSVADLKQYYTTSGFLVDQAMRKSLAAVKSAQDKGAIKSIIAAIYKPWLETVTNKFQSLVKKDASIFTDQQAISESESYILFVDAFRFELAEEFSKRLVTLKYKVDLQTGWSAIPSLTPTAKPNVSPIATAVSNVSQFNEFRPQLYSGKDLQTAAFRDSLAAHNFTFVTKPSDIIPGKNHWQEIGDIDTKGHEEQAEMVKRIDELFEQVQEIIEIAFRQDIKRIKIVTDHGWLLLPGGLPKEELKKDLTETRWGRCALIKDGAKTELLHLPWRWNPSTFIAYAPGISFFKKNEEYAHGGISIHECLVPVIIVENPESFKIQAEIIFVKWVNLKCTVNTNDVPDGYSIDIRTKFNDSKTTVVDMSNRNKKLSGNSVTLLMDDTFEYQSATIVLLDESGRILDKKPTTVGG